MKRLYVPKSESIYYIHILFDFFLSRREADSYRSIETNDPEWENNNQKKKTARQTKYFL